jgi:hypothetical protein
MTAFQSSSPPPSPWRRATPCERSSRRSERIRHRPCTAGSGTIVMPRSADVAHGLPSLRLDSSGWWIWDEEVGRGDERRKRDDDRALLPWLTAKAESARATSPETHVPPLPPRSPRSRRRRRGRHHRLMRSGMRTSTSSSSVSSTSRWPAAAGAAGHVTTLPCALPLLSYFFHLSANFDPPPFSPNDLIHYLSVFAPLNLYSPP